MTITNLQINNKEIDWEFYDYALSLEKEWKASLPRFTDKELLEIFPEAKQIIPEKIKEWEEKRTEVVDAIRRKLTLIKYEIDDEFSRWFWREWVKVNEGEELLKIDGHIARLKRLITVAQGWKPKGRITEEKIQKALSIPIESIAAQYIKLKKRGKALVGLCPFHPEKRPSFYIYSETNSFYCYGCQKGGNVINFVEDFYNLSFKEAVEFLLNNF